MTIFIARLVHRADDLVGRRDQVRAGLGEHDRVRMSVDQCCAYPAFKGLDTPAECRLADIPVFRRSGKAAGIGKANEVL